jgi:membrane protease YdiL (CAAX protease family)
MNKSKNFALTSPFLFGLVLFFMYAILGTLTYPAHFVFPESEVGQLYGDALSKFIIFLIFLLVLWRFGWIRASRINALGNANTILIVAVILVYKLCSELYAFTGDFKIPFPNSPLAIANLIYALQTSLVEETIYRGLTLVAMVSVWGDTKRGQIKAVILSSVYFGVSHMFNILIRPFGVVLLQAIIATLPGILYAAIVLSRKSLWPAFVLHWLTNAAVNIKLIGNEGYQETITMWVIFALTLIPLMVFSAYLIWKLPEPYHYETEKVG